MHFSNSIIARGTVMAGLATVVTLSASAQSASPGLRLFGPIVTGETWLVDRDEQIVHTWTSPGPSGVSSYLDPDNGDLIRTMFTGNFIGVGGEGGGVQRIGLDGTVKWDFRYDTGGNLTHHDIDLMPNGNVLMTVWEDKTNAEAIAEGRDPTLLNGSPFRPDAIIEVRPTGPNSGTIVWEWHVWDHLVQDHDPTQANFGVVANEPGRLDANFPRLVPSGGDWNHVNSIDYDPIHDVILISARSQGEIWVIDHSTTTAEAAGSTGGARGKGGDFLYRWGNPRAYRSGGLMNQQLFGQHAANFIAPGRPGAGNIMVFNNQSPNGSQVWEIVPPRDASGAYILPPSGVFGPAAPAWTYGHPDMFSLFVSSAERLENGNTLICAGAVGRVFEIDPAGNWLFNYSVDPLFVFHAHHVDRSLWADRETISIANGGRVQFDLIAGSEYGGLEYLMLGSASGTSPGLMVGPLQVPLNLDGYTLMTASNPGSFPLSQSFGTLENAGRATASFTLPPQILPPAAVGLTFHHAVVVFNLSNGQFEFVSNAVGFDLVP